MILEKRSEKKVGDRVGEKLTDNQEKILEIIIRDPLISANKISDEIGISSRKVEENIKKLKEKGIIKRIGPAKGGHWEVIKR
jgi:ATP-dependent DNA helicase RecG